MKMLFLLKNLTQEYGPLQILNKCFFTNWKVSYGLKGPQWRGNCGLWPRSVRAFSWPKTRWLSTPARPGLTLQSGHGAWRGQLVTPQPRLFRIHLYGLTGALPPPASPRQGPGYCVLPVNSTLHSLVKHITGTGHRGSYTPGWGRSLYSGSQCSSNFLRNYP